MTSQNIRRSTRKHSRKDEDNGKGAADVLIKCITDDDVGKVITGIQRVPGSIKKQKNLKESTPKVVKNEPRHRKRANEEAEDNDEETDYDRSVIATCNKPSCLYDEDDVAGEKMCSFPTPKKKLGMIQKAIESANKNKTQLESPRMKSRKSLKPGTPKHPSTPSRKFTPQKNSPSINLSPYVKLTPAKSCSTPNKFEEQSNSLPLKTPYHLRVRQKKAIQTHLRKLETEDYSDSEDSNYHGSDDASSESEECDSDSGSDSGKGSEEAVPSCRRSLRFQKLTIAPSHSKKGKDINYVFTADEYFQSQFSKCATSDHKLSRLKTPRLDSNTLQSLLTNCSMSQAHQDIVTRRREGDSDMFQRWMFALSQGFSVLAYGLGSKYKILQNFHREMLPDSHVVVVNGFFPSLNVKEIVEMIARDLLGLSQLLPTPHAIIDWIESRHGMPQIFLIIHSLDAEMLRSEKSQRILSRLANLPKVHLVASVDHINCPLLWDQAKLSSFNFMWEDTTSFFPYEEETSYETSLMVQNSGSLALSSLLNVYRSLTHNSQGVFRIILDKHLDEKNQKYVGMPFSILYSRCREEMLVTSDLALRTMLTEFLDHQMVKWRRDGEHLYIPTDVSVLQQFHKLIQER